MAKASANMIKFQYRGKQENGRPVNGIIEAPDLAEAQTRLQNRGFTHLNINQIALRKRHVIEKPQTRKGVLMYLLIIAIVLIMGLVIAQALGFTVVTDALGRYFGSAHL